MKSNDDNDNDNNPPVRFLYFYNLQPSPGLENEANTRSASSSPPSPFSFPPTLLEGLAVRSASAKCLAHTLSAPSSPSSAASVEAERTRAARSAPVKLCFCIFCVFVLGLVFFVQVRVEKRAILMKKQNSEGIGNFEHRFRRPRLARFFSSPRIEKA